MNFNLTMIGQAISFVIFVLFCMKYIWIPIISIIEKRQKEVSDIFVSAEEIKKQSEIDRIEAVNCLKQAKVEAKLIIEQANQYKKELIDQAKFEAYAHQEQILSQARDAIRIERKCVSEELRKEISEIIVFGVEKIIECSIDSRISANVINKVLNEFLTHEININI